MTFRHIRERLQAHRDACARAEAFLRRLVPTDRSAEIYGAHITASITGPEVTARIQVAPALWGDIMRGAGAQDTTRTTAVRASVHLSAVVHGVELVTVVQPQPGEVEMGSPLGALIVSRVCQGAPDDAEAVVADPDGGTL